MYIFRSKMPKWSTLYLKTSNVKEGKQSFSLYEFFLYIKTCVKIVIPNERLSLYLNITVPEFLSNRISKFINCKQYCLLHSLRFFKNTSWPIQSQSLRCMVFVTTSWNLLPYFVFLLEKHIYCNCNLTTFILAYCWSLELKTEQ